jgi:hypothetical protein
MAGASVVRSATTYTARKITPRVNHGTANAMCSQLGVRRESLITPYATASPSPVPTTIAVSAMNDDSMMKLSCTMLLRKPIARSTPICCRRSTTARAVTTPSAATPTINPRPMNPMIRRSRQREIISRHFGFGRTAEEITEVAGALHLSQQRTRAIERDGLYALRDRLEDS